jgi:hypothetical protein
MEGANPRDRDRTSAMSTSRNAFQACILGYLSAVAAASVTLFAILFARIPPQPIVPFTPDLFITFSYMLLLTGLVVFATALCPFAIVITLGERFRINNIVYYVGCGALTGAAVVAGFFARDTQSLPSLSQHWIDLLGTGCYFVASGAVGGFVHWWVSGRHAGAGSS